MLYTFQVLTLLAVSSYTSAGIVPIESLKHKEAPAVSYSYLSRPLEHISLSEHSTPIIKKTFPSITYSAPIEKHAHQAVSYISHLPSVVHQESPLRLYEHEQPYIHHAPSILTHHKFPIVQKHEIDIPTVHKTVIPLHKHLYTLPIHKEEDHYAPAFYDFGYAVEDHHTGDIKQQKEILKDDTIHGIYSLIDPDGFKRTVQYTADDHNGFIASVLREPIGKIVGKHQVKLAEHTPWHHQNNLF